MSSACERGRVFRATTTGALPRKQGVAFSTPCLRCPCYFRLQAPLPSRARARSSSSAWERGASSELAHHEVTVGAKGGLQR